MKRSEFLNRLQKAATFAGMYNPHVRRERAREAAKDQGIGVGDLEDPGNPIIIAINSIQGGDLALFRFYSLRAIEEEAWEFFEEKSRPAGKLDVPSGAEV